MLIKDEIKNITRKIDYLDCLLDRCYVEAADVERHELKQELKEKLKLKKLLEGGTND